jgi:tetratricopeptide (TPR) repeat protein
MPQERYFANSGALLARLVSAAQRLERVTFLFGSAITAPGPTPNEKGVPDANAFIQEVVGIFKGTDELAGLEEILKRAAPTSRYQEAMQYVIHCRGQDVLNELVKDAVLKARKTSERQKLDPRTVEMDSDGWYLRPAVKAVGYLVKENPQIFTAPILTSNFDPLLEVSVRKAGGQAETIILSADGQFTNVLSVQTQVVHFHGFWRGGDTLHTPSQLTRNRPQLKGCLRSVLGETTLVVIGYGGWSDVFTRTLVEVISEQTEQLNVLWTFYSDNDEDINGRNTELLQQCESLAGQRVVFYKGVNCHVFLPLLRDRLLALHQPQSEPATSADNLEMVPEAIRETAEGGDRPPMADAWVGREVELRQLLSSRAKVVAVTGLGGIGKSTLASKYLQLKQGAAEIAYFCWADCREQGNTLHTQLVRMIERISNGSIKSSQLAEFNTEAVIESLFAVLDKTRAILVFDNIDQYVDVEQSTAVGTMDVLIRTALSYSHSAQFVFTGRPELVYSHPEFVQVELTGLSIEETHRLFEVRGVHLDVSRGTDQIAEAHNLTNGHALTLNLIASQVARNGASLEDLLNKLRKGTEGGFGDSIFREIWGALNAKQQTVLRYLAEIVHPESEQRIGNYLGEALNYNQFSKAIRALKALNLVVVKPSGERAADTVELHPLVRDFVRRHFPMAERAHYIASIIDICDQMIRRFRSSIFSVPFSVLENWTAKIELCLECGRYSEALEALAEVDISLRRNGYSEEFVRLAIEVLDKCKPSGDEKELSHLDHIYQNVVESLTELGRFREADEYISRFEETIIGKTARYVLFCNVCGYSFWFRKDYKNAKEWAGRGVELKTGANLDTKHDSSHTLALAQRDSGEVDPALLRFLQGEKLETILDPKEYEPKRGGHYYGNIGRCLQFQNKLDEALICYRKSARILETGAVLEHAMNNGWAAQWIGEILERTQKLPAAYVAYRHAASKWKHLSPARSREAREAAGRIRENLPSKVVPPTNDWECEKAYIEWLKKG